MNKNIFNPFDENLSEIEKVSFLYSETYKKLLRDLIVGLLGRYDIVVHLLPPTAPDIAYTDGANYYINPLHEIFSEDGICSITGKIVAVIAHETFHGLYTDFPFWNKKLDTVPNEEVKLYKWLFNSFCDARIERIGCVEFPGIADFVIDFRADFYNFSKDEKVQNNAQALLNNMLLFATCGKKKYEMNKEANELFEKSASHIIKARRSNTTKECSAETDIIFKLIYEFVKNETPPMPPTGYSKPRKGRPQKHSADSGQDIISFPSDDIDDENNLDEENENNQNNDNSSGGKDDKSSENKSSGNENKKEDGEDGTSENENPEKNDKNSNQNSNQKSNKKSNKNSDEKSDENSDKNASNGNDNENSSDNHSTGSDDTDNPSSPKTIEDLAKENVENFISDALKKSAKEYEEERRNKELDAKVYTALESNSDYSCKVVCARPSNSTTYDEMVRKTSSIIADFVKRIQVLLKRNKLLVLHRQERGSIDSFSLPYMSNGACFKQKIKPREVSDLFVSIINDCSGSMKGQRLIKTALASTILLEGCTALNIPISVKSFSGSSHNCLITHYYDPLYKNQKNKSNISQLYADGGTPLAQALVYEKKYLQKIKNKDKLIFVITDGEPNDITSAALKIKELSKNAIVYGVAIGNNVEKLNSLFGNNFIDARNLDTLPIQIARIIEKNIIK